MEPITVTTTQNIGLEYELASLWERIAGRIIDGLIIGAYAVLVALIIFNTNLWDNFQWGLILFVLPVFFYDLISEVWMNGQSVGKRVMHIKVISLGAAQPWPVRNSVGVPPRRFFANEQHMRPRQCCSF
jgi:uncharacterized RDD family membrane protein YckC